MFIYARCPEQNLFVEARRNFSCTDVYLQVQLFLVVPFSYLCSKKIHGWLPFPLTLLWLIGQLQTSYSVFLLSTYCDDSINDLMWCYSLTVAGLQLWWHSLSGLLGYHSCWYSRVGLMKNIKMIYSFFLHDFKFCLILKILLFISKLSLQGSLWNSK
jgi:hypothetical protein